MIKVAQTRKTKEDNEWERSALTEEKEQGWRECLYWKFAISSLLSDIDIQCQEWEAQGDFTKIENVFVVSYLTLELQYSKSNGG